MWAHLAVFALSIVLPLWCLLGLIAWTSVRQARDDYQQQTMVVARNMALELDRELAGFSGILSALATSPALQDGDLRRFHEQAVRVAPAGGAIVMRDRSGQQLVSTLFPFGTPLPVTAAAAVRAADECVFRTRSTCVSDLYIGTTDRQPYILLDAPVFRDGEVEFALNIAVRAQHLASLLARHQLPAGWAASITDRQHRIVARSPEHERFVGSLANAALRENTAADEGRVRSVNVAGVPVWGAYVRLPAWGWRVAIGVPEEVLGAPLRRSLFFFGAAGVLAIGLSIAAALLYGRRLARSIGALDRLAAAVGGSVAPSALSTSIRELDSVSASLAEADVRLRASYAERDRAQTELQRLNDELRAQVEAEVAAREEAQLQLAQAQRMEALGQLAGGIAHDFNNVLQAVQGGARLIQGDAADEGRVRRLASMIVDAASRGAAVTRRLLAFARRADLRAEAVDAAELLAAMREILQHTLGTGIEVRVTVSPGVPAFFADRGQLETVLVNLAANARDAMRGAGALTLSAVSETVAMDGDATSHPPGPKPGTYVQLSVADTGIGMDASTLARAAEPFFTTKARGQGTGLGLAMARGFAEQSGGALHIESAPSCGTTVRIWLPVAQHAPVGVHPPVAETGHVTEARHRILLVDDEALVCTLTAEELKTAGFNIHAVGSGAEALKLIEAGESIDLLITDLSMPGMDGLALIREAQQRRPDLPAILLTGFATDRAELAIGGAVSGSFSLLRKPIEARLLAERAAVLLMAAEPSRA
ncbi:response regulator [Falsiroseomonas oryzae]|uniref:response regulator n=1 Tax=Falsiroseomonas oryzae TaxID=2766473 RepID=UPI0022EA71F5|nr:response regulator [Roseomonas sp. MO-31]